MYGRAKILITYYLLLITYYLLLITYYLLLITYYLLLIALPNLLKYKRAGKDAPQSLQRGVDDGREASLSKEAALSKEAE